MLNIYVGNLDYSISSDDLRELFEEFGTVNSANVITDRDTRRSKGFGFIEMEDDDEAHEAIEELDGAEFEGRTIKVNEARPREDNRGRGNKNRSFSRR